MFLFKTIRRKWKINMVQPQKILVASETSAAPSSTIDTLQYFLALSQFFGMLPLQQGNGTFKWKSWKVFYTFIIMISLLVTTCYCLLYWFTKRGSVAEIELVMFFGGSLITIIIYLRLTTKWSNVQKDWHRIDTIMNPNYGYPKSLNKRIVILIIIYTLLSLTDFASILDFKFSKLKATYGNNVTLELFFKKNLPQIYLYLPVNSFMITLTMFLILQGCVARSFNDLFIIITSINLALRFKEISEKISKDAHEWKPISYWRTIREDYDRLAQFSKLLDNHISELIVLSYFLNIFSILTQLFYSLVSDASTRDIHFVFFCLYLLFKTASVSLYAAWINDESKAPATILNSFGPSLFNIEVKRLLTQISFDRVALSGCKMFYVKRGIILNIASAIVTYELVLIQFNQETVGKL